MTEQSVSVSSVQPVLSSSFVTVVRLFMTGLVVGVLIISIMTVSERYIFARLFCEDQTSCIQAASAASITAYIMGAIIGSIALVAQRIYRPLMVVAMITLALWGVHVLVGETTTNGFIQAGINGGLFGIGYALFGHLALIKNFYASLGLSLLVVVVIRLASTL